MFAPLRQPAFFNNFKVEQGGYAIVWNEDIALSEYELWKNGMTVAEGDRSDVAIEEIEDAIEEVMPEI